MDNAFLVSLVGLRPEKYFWLGLSKQKDIDNFEWTNTDSVRFTHWNTRMPGTETNVNIQYRSETINKSVTIFLHKHKVTIRAVLP